MKSFSQRALKSRVSSIKQMAALSTKIKGAISLSQGVPSFSTPVNVRKGVAHALLADEPGLGKYSLYMGTLPLRKAIAQRLSYEFKKKVDAEKNLFVSCGSLQGLLASILAIIDSGDEVIVPVPNYSPHFQHIHIAGGKEVPVFLNEGQGWSLDVDSLEKAITKKTKLIIITNPGNPLGNVYDVNTLISLAKVAKKHDLWVLADETYGYLTYDTSFVSCGALSEFGKNLIISRTFSKEYAMTGWRVGFIYADEEFIKQALKMHDPMVVAVPSISQKAALLALTADQTIVSDMVKIMYQRRQLFCSLLSQIAQFSFVKPKGAYYVFARISKDLLKRYGPTSKEFALRMLKEARVATVPGDEFKPPKDEYIRFSFADDEKILKEAIRRIKNWLSS